MRRMEQASAMIREAITGRNVLEAECGCLDYPRQDIAASDRRMLARRSLQRAALPPCIRPSGLIGLHV